MRLFDASSKILSFFFVVVVVVICFALSFQCEGKTYVFSHLNMIFGIFLYFFISSLIEGMCGFTVTAAWELFTCLLIAHFFVHFFAHNKKKPSNVPMRRAQSVCFSFQNLDKNNRINDFSIFHSNRM